MLMANNLIFKSNDIEVITKKYNSVNNKFNIIQKITRYCDLEIIKNLLDENTIKKNIYSIFNQICKRNNNDLTNFFYYKFENIINEKIENVFRHNAPLVVRTKKVNEIIAIDGFKLRFAFVNILVLGK